jgi:hypothetical protein
MANLKFRLFYSNLVEILDRHKDFAAGPTELKHYLDHVECGRGSTRYRKQFPLRDQPLECNTKAIKLPEAMGLHLMEKLCVIWVIIFGLGFFGTTLIFGISWWALKGDIQGAFGAAGFFSSFLGVVALSITATVSL